MSSKKEPIPTSKDGRPTKGGGESKSIKLPSNVTRTRGKSVKRFGVKIRFNGFSLRIGSAYCTAEDASIVASAFRKVAFINKDGEIDFYPTLYHKYGEVIVSIYLPFTTTIDTVSVADYLTKWLATMKRRPLKEERYFGAKKTEGTNGAKKQERAKVEGRYQSATDSALGQPAVLGKRGPGARLDRAVGTKSLRTDSPSDSRVVLLQMENEMLKREIARMKGKGTYTMDFMVDDDESATASSLSTTSSSGDEKDDDMSLGAEMTSLPSYNPLFVSILGAPTRRLYESTANQNTNTAISCIFTEPWHRFAR